MPTEKSSIEMHKAEARLREMAFRIAYDHVFATVQDLTARFAYAIAYSARPIEKPGLVRAWWQWTRGKRIKILLNEGKEPPSALRQIVNAYLAAVEQRAAQTGDRTEDLL